MLRRRFGSVNRERRVPVRILPAFTPWISRFQGLCSGVCIQALGENQKARRVTGLSSFVRTERLGRSYCLAIPNRLSIRAIRSSCRWSSSRTFNSAISPASTLIALWTSFMPSFTSAKPAGLVPSCPELALESLKAVGEQRLLGDHAFLRVTIAFPIRGDLQFSEPCSLT